MVSKSFDINTVSLQPFELPGKRLIIELSSSSVAIILWNSSARLPEAVEIFNGDHGEPDDWQSMLQQSRLLGFTELETLISTAYPEMLLVPASLYSPESAKAQLDLFYGFKPGHYVGGDVLHQIDTVVAWELPANVKTFLTNHFSVTKIQHLVTSLLLHHKAHTGASGHIVLQGNMVWVLIWKQDQLQIAKSFSFLKPEDLQWHLLNLCRQLAVEPGSIRWKISGMAEESSPLWQAITCFFDMSEPMDAGIVRQEELPGHYFAHLFVGL